MVRVRGRDRQPHAKRAKGDGGNYTSFAGNANFRVRPCQLAVVL